MIPVSPLVKNLIIINVIVYFAVTFLFPNWLIYFQAYYPASGNFRPIQLVTHMFMHGNLMPHLFFNMFMLYMFGSTLEYYWGRKYFLLVYLASGFGAIAFHYFVNYLAIQYYRQFISPEMYQEIINNGTEILNKGKNYLGFAGKINLIINIPAVGSSGAVYGILAGFGTQFPRQKLMLLFPPIPIEARILIPGLIILELFLGLGGSIGLGGSDGIAHFAHIGGAMVGFILVRYRYKFNM